MMRIIYGSSRRLLAVLLMLSCTATLAVPKAAEHADAEVSFGAATVHPKPPPRATKKPQVTEKSRGSKSRITGGRSAQKKTSAKARGSGKSKSRK